MPCLCEHQPFATHLRCFRHQRDDSRETFTGNVIFYRHPKVKQPLSIFSRLLLHHCGFFPPNASLEPHRSVAAGLLSMQQDPGTRACLCRIWLCTPAGKPLSGSSCQWVGGRAAPSLLRSCWHPLRWQGSPWSGGPRWQSWRRDALGSPRLCSADCDLHKTLSPSPGGRSRRRLLFPSLAEPEELGAGFYSLQRGIQLLPALTYHPWPQLGRVAGGSPVSRALGTSLLQEQPLR